jgi:hypothetical protein
MDKYYDRGCTNRIRDCLRQPYVLACNVYNNLSGHPMDDLGCTEGVAILDCLL